MTALLTLAGLRRHFQGVRAIDGVDLVVEEGRCLGLIGPNGAGKSTLFALVAGLLEADAGQVLLAGREVSGVAPERRVRLGLGWSFLHAPCYPDLTVRQHLEVADAQAEPEGFDAHLEGYGLASLAERPARDLSLAERKLLDIARATWRKPRLLLLDEPFAGLGEGQAGRLQGVLRRLREQGVTFVVIEHRLAELLTVAEEIAVLAAGRIIHRGAPRETLESPQVLRSYFGIDDDDDG